MAVFSDQPGGSAQYTLSLSPQDVPFSVDLSLSDPSTHITPTLSAQRLSPGEPITLTLAHDGTPGTQVYTLTISATGSGFTGSAKVDLLVGGNVLYLPAIRRP